MAEDQDDAPGYYVVPEDALQYLPSEWREQAQAVVDDGRRVIADGDNELRQLARVSTSFINLVVLKHIRDKLAAYRFEPKMDAILELDMLTTAFVATYARLQQGGAGSGFARDALPEHLRSVHDVIIELRNKRYAHAADHESISNAMEIRCVGDTFVVNLGMSFGYHVGGAIEWQEIVDHLDELFANRADSILKRLERKTGRKWRLSVPE